MRDLWERVQEKGGIFTCFFYFFEFLDVDLSPPITGNIGRLKITVASEKRKSETLRKRKIQAFSLLEDGTMFTTLQETWCP